LDDAGFTDFVLLDEVDESGALDLDRLTLAVVERQHEVEEVALAKVARWLLLEVRASNSQTVDPHTSHAVHTHLIKAAFHDTDMDTDTDSPDTPTSLYVRHARFPREDVGVGVVECGLYHTVKKLERKNSRRYESYDAEAACAAPIEDKWMHCMGLGRDHDTPYIDIGTLKALTPHISKFLDENLHNTQLYTWRA